MTWRKPILSFDLWEICLDLIFFMFIEFVTNIQNHTNQGFKLFRHPMFVFCKHQGIYEKEKKIHFNLK